MKAACALLLGAAFAAAGPSTGQGTSESLAARAAELRAQNDSARSGHLIEYHLARSGLESCERAIRLLGRDEREIECREAQRRVDACNARRDRWVQALDAFTLEVLTIPGEAQRHAALLKTPMPACPSTLPGQAEGPGEALSAISRREREALPGFSICETYLRALLGAADDGKAPLVEALAIDLVDRCGADHPDYRRQAVAALTRVGVASSVLDRPRPVAAPASAAASAASAP